MSESKDTGFDNVESIIWQYQPSQPLSTPPWGPHQLPVKMVLDGLSLSLEKGDTGYYYRREDQSSSVEKLVRAGKGEIYLCPVEPFHQPEGVSRHLLLEFEQPVLIEPRKSIKIYLTAPLEIAVVLTLKRNDETVLDLLSFLKPKLTLYGSIKTGLVCRYWKSNIYDAVPQVNPLREGVMQLSINNNGNRWAEIKQAVFSAQDMKIYYNTQLSAMQAIMRINSELTAETTFIDKPLMAGMNKATEQFSSKLPGLAGRLVMEDGY